MNDPTQDPTFQSVKAGFDAQVEEARQRQELQEYRRREAAETERKNSEAFLRAIKPFAGEPRPVAPPESEPVEPTPPLQSVKTGYLQLSVKDRREFRQWLDALGM